MLWAYTQQLDPLAGHVFWSPFWSTVVAVRYKPLMARHWLTSNWVLVLLFWVTPIHSSLPACSFRQGS